MHSQGVIDAVLPAAANSPPLFARWGNIIPLTLALLLIAGGIVLRRKRR
jgi:apolipoprotein N-acyltransferase